MRPASRLLFALAAGALGLAGAAAAHELGTIRTNAFFQKSGEYRVRVFIDREHLPPGFASAAAPPRIPIRGFRWDPADRVSRILAEVLNHSRITFDGRIVEPRAEWEAPDLAAAELVLNLSGAIPPGAKTFTWSNDLKLGSYLLTLPRGRKTPSGFGGKGGIKAGPSSSRRRWCRRRGGRSRSNTSRSDIRTFSQGGAITSSSSSGSFS